MLQWICSDVWQDCYMAQVTLPQSTLVSDNQQAE